MREPTKSQSDLQAAIIGGGIGGLTAAIALRQVGIAAVVYERAPKLEEVGAGLSLWTNAMQALSTLGLDEAFSTTRQIMPYLPTGRQVRLVPCCPPWRGEGEVATAGPNCGSPRPGARCSRARGAA
jgi:glycine/D-amino acid oxidase-like deaminating enzyme